MNNDSKSGLQQFLPIDLIDEIRERFAEAIRMAEKHFNSHSADEDSVTGALGQELSRIGPISKEVDGQQFNILFGYKKLRGRGPGAPEKEYGADGLFEISILDLNGEVLFNKGLPFQSKIKWKGKDVNLLEQAERIQQHLCGGIVIDYSEEGYKACSTENVIAAEGTRKNADHNKSISSLEESLCDDYLNCLLGTKDLLYDRKRNLFLFPPSNSNRDTHLIYTTVIIENP